MFIITEYYPGSYEFVITNVKVFKEEFGMEAMDSFKKAGLGLTEAIGCNQPVVQLTKLKADEYDDLFLKSIDEDREYGVDHAFVDWKKTISADDKAWIEDSKY